MTSNNVDRLSVLPEDIHSHIFSFMPTKYAVRTSILAKSWRYRWTCVTNLDFDDRHPFHGLHSLKTFIDRVLSLCKTNQINSFRLRFKEMWVPESSVSKWINEAVRLNVSELYAEPTPINLPCIFTCKTLTKLSVVWHSESYSDWYNKLSIDLPLLKTLNIKIFGPTLFNASKIMRGFPLLESLFLDIEHSFSDEDCNLNILTLKHLEIRTRKGLGVNQVVLNLPVLESFLFWGTLSSSFVAEDLSSLISVTVSCCNNSSSTDLWVELLKAIAGAKSVSMLIPHMVPPNVALPNFLNLKHLELTSSSRDLTWIPRQRRNVDWLLFPQILQSCPELEHLCVEGGSDDTCWIELECVPMCMLKSLRTIKFESCKSWKFNVKFLAYMLGNAEVLKTVTIVCNSLPMEQEMRLCAELLKLPRASRYCEVHFHGSMSHSPST